MNEITTINLKNMTFIKDKNQSILASLVKIKLSNYSSNLNFGLVFILKSMNDIEIIHAFKRLTLSLEVSELSCDDA